MKLPSLFRKPTTSTAARTMRMAGVAKDRALIRSTCDQMRERMGMPKAEWPQ